MNNKLGDLHDSHQSCVLKTALGDPLLLALGNGMTTCNYWDMSHVYGLGGYCTVAMTIVFCSRAIRGTGSSGLMSTTSTGMMITGP